VFDDEPTLPGQEISFIETPTHDEWKLTPIYMDNIQGKLMVWQVGFAGQQLTTMHGQVGGSMQYDTREVLINTSGRTLQQQALLEARSRYNDKLHQGYTPGGEELPVDLRNTSPALANKYIPPHTNADNRTFPGNITQFPVAGQAKLDGIRALSKRCGNLSSDNPYVTMRSRQNRAYPHFEHIKSALLKFFDYLPPNSELDGEFYSFDMDFTMLSSVVRTTKVAHVRIGEVKYFIFDLIEPRRLPYEDRYDLLSKAYLRYQEDVKATQVGNATEVSKATRSHEGGTGEFFLLTYARLHSHADIEACHKYYVEQGFEGLMLRKMGNGHSVTELNNSQYKSGRSSNILKYKHFLDEEATVISVEEGTGREAGLALLKVRDVRGHEFSVRPRGDFTLRRTWFQHPELIVGKAYTIRYQELSVYGIPRFPVGVAVRDYE